MDANRIVSCGMDHYLKLWNLDKEGLKMAIEKSSKWDNTKSNHKYVESPPPPAAAKSRRVGVDGERWWWG